MITIKYNKITFGFAGTELYKVGNESPKLTANPIFLVHICGYKALPSRSDLSNSNAFPRLSPLTVYWMLHGVLSKS